MTGIQPNMLTEYDRPVRFDNNDELPGGESYTGQYIKDVLYQHRNDNLPGGGSLLRTPPGVRVR